MRRALPLALVLLLGCVDAASPRDGSDAEAPDRPAADTLRGDSAKPADTGDALPDAGQPRQDEGDARPDAGDVRPDAGDARPDTATAGSGLDRTRPVRSLSDRELGLLCDYGVALLGGYGTTVACVDGTSLRNAAGRAACVAGHDRGPSCLATVGDSEDCLRALAGGCSQRTLRVLPACVAMVSCQGP